MKVRRLAGDSLARSNSSQTSRRGSKDVSGATGFLLTNKKGRTGFVNDGLTAHFSKAKNQISSRQQVNLLNYLIVAHSPVSRVDAEGSLRHVASDLLRYSRSISARLEFTAFPEMPALGPSTVPQGDGIMA